MPRGPTSPTMRSGSSPSSATTSDWTRRDPPSTSSGPIRAPASKSYLRNAWPLKCSTRRFPTGWLTSSSESSRTEADSSGSKAEGSSFTYRREAQRANCSPATQSAISPEVCRRPPREHRSRCKQATWKSVWYESSLRQKSDGGLVDNTWRHAVTLERVGGLGSGRSAAAQLLTGGVDAAALEGQLDRGFGRTLRHKPDRAFCPDGQGQLDAVQPEASGRRRIRQCGSDRVADVL